MTEYRYIYEDLVKNRREIVTTISQLSELSGMNVRDISRNFKESDIYCHRHGLFRIERAEYKKNGNKARKTNGF